MTDTPEIPPHVRRMAAEFRELADRRGKLAAFIEGPTFDALDDDDAGLLIAQYSAMSAYEGVLGIRLRRAGL